MPLRAHPPRDVRGGGSNLPGGPLVSSVPPPHRLRNNGRQRGDLRCLPPGAPRAPRVSGGPVGDHRLPLVSARRAAPQRPAARHGRHLRRWLRVVGAPLGGDLREPGRQVIHTSHHRPTGAGWAPGTPVPITDRRLPGMPAGGAAPPPLGPRGDGHIGRGILVEVVGPLRRKFWVSLGQRHPAAGARPAPPWTPGPLASTVDRRLPLMPAVTAAPAVLLVGPRGDLSRVSVHQLGGKFRTESTAWHASLLM